MLPAFNNTVYQLPSLTLLQGSTSSNARLGAGQTTQANFIGISFASGTNLTQRGNTNTAAATASQLSIFFSARWRNVGAPLTGLTAGASFGLVGNIPTGGAAFTRIELDCTFRYFSAAELADEGYAEGQLMRSPLAPTPFYFRNTPGSFTASPRDVVATVPNTLFNGDEVLIQGFLRISVHNDDDENTLEILEGGSIAEIPAPGATAGLALLGLLAARRRR